MHNSLVGMGSCEQRVFASGSGGKTAAATAARSGEEELEQEEEGKNRDRKWPGLGCFTWAYVVTGYGDEEQCYQSHWHLQAKVLL